VGVTRSNACRLATPNSVHEYCFSFRLSVRRTALLGEYSVKVGGTRLRLVIHSSWRLGREKVRFSIESIIELLTFRYAIDNSREDYIRNFTNLRNPYGLSRCAWKRSLLRVRSASGISAG
jgi:hypothetical protein